MDEERLYQVYGHYNYTLCLVDCIIKVKVGENIIEKANDALTEAFGEVRPCVASIIKEIPKCEGCQIEACGQRAHMLHPNGCLHDPTDCELCEMEVKNILKLSQIDNKDNDQKTKSLSINV